MVILNDSPNVQYTFDHPNVRIINHPTRFGSLAEKLFYGFSQCRGEYIYRLDDDDLLSPFAMDLVKEQIKNDADIFRCKKAYFLRNNEYSGFSENVNNGNCYRKEWLDTVKLKNVSIVEDVELTYKSGGRIFTDEGERCTMFYRWNMDTFHISTLGVQHSENNEYLLNEIDNRVQGESGVIALNPHFKIDYYSFIN